jgi:hypothetical protein
MLMNTAFEQGKDGKFAETRRVSGETALGKPQKSKPCKRPLLRNGGISNDLSP